jgi:uncharacterized protein (DUF983 family)
LVGRSLRRRCPYCGAPGIFANYLTLRDSCPTCGRRFAREEGYFLGAYAVNLIAAEVLGLGIALYLLFATPLARLSIDRRSLIAAAIAIGLPIVFYPFSRTLWMALDLFLDRPPDPGDSRPGTGAPDRPA